MWYVLKVVERKERYINVKLRLRITKLRLV